MTDGVNARLFEMKIWVEILGKYSSKRPKTMVLDQFQTIKPLIVPFVAYQSAKELIFY